jgi:AAA15 family ATPase/GTPase
MLIEFSVENFLSFRDKTSFSMVSSGAFREHRETHTIQADKKLNLLKTSVLYGNNASGKSNFLRAIQFMKNYVLNSFRNALSENKSFAQPDRSFALNTENQNKANSFEVSFIYKELKYRYGFELDGEKVISEHLYHNTTKETFLFKRNKQTIEINKSSFKEGLGKETEARENVLFVSLLATLNKEISSNIINWFKEVQLINGVNDFSHARYTIEKIKQESKFVTWVSYFLRDLEIANVSTIEEEFSMLDLFESNEKANQSLRSKMEEKKLKSDTIVTFHRKYDKDNLYLDLVPFQLEREESEGTKKLIYLLGPIYDSLKNGKVLFIDELDSRLHTLLTVRLIKLFHDYNINQSQLIFISHDTNIMDKEIFRRDQIWFVEKDQFGSSQLLTLGDFKSTHVRSTTSFNRNYLQGKYGSIPHLSFDEKMNDYLYE